MFWHNRSHVNLYPSGPIHKCYFNMKYPSLYCAWFVESCQTSPSKKIKRNFGIVKSIFVYYIFACDIFVKAAEIFYDSTRPCHDAMIGTTRSMSVTWDSQAVEGSAKSNLGGACVRAKCESYWKRVSYSLIKIL